MTAAPVALRSPKLLLDTNLFRDLADGVLADREQRLRQIAAFRRPPLFWLAPLVFEEVICHFRPEEEKKFGHLWAAVRWMEDLCGNDGVADGLESALRNAVLRQPPPNDAAHAANLNVFRRQLLKASAVGSLHPKTIQAISERRMDFTKAVTAWTELRRQTFGAVTIPPENPRARGVDLVTTVVVTTFREQAIEVTGALQSDLRSELELETELREFIAFERSHLQKARSPGGYKAEKHDTDYNDAWLLAYLAVGYTLVTNDTRLRKALSSGGCVDPRVVDVDGALAIAEAWLTGRKHRTV